MKKSFNPDSVEEVNKIVGGNPSGIANFAKPSRKIYKTIYDGMLARTWFPATVDLSNDKAMVPRLSEAELRMYKLTFGKLIFNDSIVTNRIMDDINQYITDPIANACLARQSFEESLHSLSYAFIGDDVLGDLGIYNLWRTDEKLLALAKLISSNYNMFEHKPTNEELAIACCSSMCLEGISFPCGFLPIWALGDRMQGSASMITEISRDELGSHLPLYANIYRHIQEDYDCNSLEIRREATKMIDSQVKAEIEYLVYSTEGVLGFSLASITNYVHWIGNARSRELGFGEPFVVTNPDDGLIKIFKKYSIHNETKTNFFEGSVKNYSKEKLDMDF